MNEALYYIIGTHDFEPLSRLNPDYSSYICTVFHTDILLKDENLIFRIRANRFMHGMVRSIMGMLVDIGREAHDTRVFDEILSKKDRSLVSSKAPAHGLYLEKVNY
jgi:tRNA pseudouridine38-40 synthase